MSIKDRDTEEVNAKVTGLVGLALLAFLCLGLFLGSNLMAPTKTEYITLPPEVITTTVGVVKYKTVEVPHIVRETVMVEVLVKLRNFKDTDELDAFLIKDDTDSRIILKANSEGIVSLHGNCEDIALQLQERAGEAGYKMSFQFVGTMKLNSDEQWILTGRGHAICSVIIGNECIFIEPSTDDFWIGAYLD